MMKALVMLTLAVILGAAPARAMDVTLDTASARMVLQALRNPALDRSQALAVAKLPGNQGLVQKAISYHVDATTETVADALVAAAHGIASDTPTANAMHFDRVKLKSDALLALITRIEDQPDRFQAWVVQRVGQFSPKNAPLHIVGYLIAGGNSGGFAFDDPKFYLNLEYFSEFDPARVVMAHELYHAVQAAHAADHDDTWLKPASPTAAGKARQRSCADLANLFASLYDEGSASYVGDPLLLDPQSGPLAKQHHDELAEGLNSPKAHRTLLELSVIGLQAPQPVPFEDVYALGFYVPEPLYKLGYAMAKAIATDEGAAALTGFLDQPGYRFALHYTRLPLYGKDRAHPALGPHAVDAIHRLDAGCPPGSG
jgi:hypothetical protein